jgi:hypothetical protein
MLLATALLPCLFIQHLGHEDDDGLGRGELNTGAPRSEAGKSELCWLGEAPLPLASTSRGCPTATDIGPESLCSCLSPAAHARSLARTRNVTTCCVHGPARIYGCQ